jgi:hypothetical protein
MSLIVIDPPEDRWPVNVADIERALLRLYEGRGSATTEELAAVGANLAAFSLESLELAAWDEDALRWRFTTEGGLHAARLAAGLLERWGEV